MLAPGTQVSDPELIFPNQPYSQPAPIVIVGTGPVGIACAQRLLDRNPLQPLVIYGNEPWRPYDRVGLTALLNGDKDLEQLDNPLRTIRAAQVVNHFNCAIVAIDRQCCRVQDQTGRWQAYSQLVLAVGSSAAVPRIDGVNLAGVFKLRDLNDVEGLIARRARSRHTVVLGGGLLGLEAARAMQRNHTQVTLVHRGPRLLNRQLDTGAGELFSQTVAALGIQVVLNTSLRGIAGELAVESVQLSDGTQLACDTVIIATGIRANITLAQAAGISVGQGIKVNDVMQTSDPAVYAVGECAEHREQVHGLVAPGLEQARVAAEHLLGQQSTYTGSLQATSLKVLNQPTFSIGRIGEQEDGNFDRSSIYSEPATGVYRKIITRRGRAVGAVALGDWQELARVREAVTHGRRIWPHQRLRLRYTGRLWPKDSSLSVSQWPAAATVCNCRSVNRGSLSGAVDAGAQTVEALMQHTGAATVCGSCRPLLQEIVDATNSPANASPTLNVPFSRPLLLLSLLTLLLAVGFFLVPAIPVATTVTLGFTLDQLWTNGLFKQISGFSLLALSLLGMLLSLRKRMGLIGGRFTRWRLWHVVLGISCFAVLLGHTGLALGNNLNQWLMVNFLALAALGGLLGGITALERRFFGQWGSRLRRWWGWCHILALWPLPALLGFHILAVYYY